MQNNTPVSVIKDDLPGRVGRVSSHSGKGGRYRNKRTEEDPPQRAEIRALQLLYPLERKRIASP